MHQQIALQLGDARPIRRSPPSGGRSTTCAYSGGRLAIDRSRSRTEERYSSRRLLVACSEPGFRAHSHRPARRPGCSFDGRSTTLPWCRTAGRRGDAGSFPAAADGRDRPSSCCAGCFRRSIPEKRRSAGSGSRESRPSLAGDCLIDGWAACSAARERLARNNGAHRRGGGCCPDPAIAPQGCRGR